jgi:hypothetical protein
MIISDISHTCSCNCGARLSLQNSNDSQSSDSQTFGDAMTGEEFRMKLAQTHERHIEHCVSYFEQNEPDSSNPFASANRLEFQIFGGHLCAFCSTCSYFEQIT